MGRAALPPTMPETTGPRAFLDTTVLCDRLLGDEQRVARVRAKLARYAARVTSGFVKLEFLLGAYGHLARFQALAESGVSFAELHSLATRYATLPPPAALRRVGSVMLRAFNFFFGELDARRPIAEPLRERFRAFLRRFVRKAWKDALDPVDRVIDPSASLSDLPEPRWNDQTKTLEGLPPRRYAVAKAPHLAAFVRRERAQFQRVLEALDCLPADALDPETRRRRAAIRKILEGGDEASASDIRRVGDALVAVECPHDHDLLNNNPRHFDPICAALGKRSVRSFDPA